MAEKKSWRDYSKNSSTEKDSTEKTGTWRDYTSDKSTSGKTSSGWRNYTDYDPTAIVGNNIVNRVNRWLQNHNSYISDYQKRYEGRKGTYEDAYVADSADWLETARQRKSSLDSEADAILSYIDQYDGYLDEKWVDNIRKTLTGTKGTLGQTLYNANKDNQFWAKFTPNEEQAAAGYTAEKLYKEWQTGLQQTTNDLAFDIAAGELELERLKQERANNFDELWKSEPIEDKMGKWMVNPNYKVTVPNAPKNATPSNSKLDEYDKKIANLEEQIERAKYVQGYAGYMNNMSAEDFGVNSQYISTRTDVAKEDAHWGLYGEYFDTGKLFSDFDYDYINRNEDALGVGMVNDTNTLSTLTGVDDAFLKTMTDDEIRVFNYLYKTQNPEAAYNFIGFITSDLKGRKRVQEQGYWANLAKESPVKSSIFSTLISPLKGLSYLGQTADMLDDGKMEQNAGYNRFSYIPSTIRSQVSSTIENSGKWGKVGSFAYNTGMSMADFLFTTAVSGGNQAMSLAIMGSGAAADATLAAKDRGLSDGEAFTLGTIAGLAEVAMERISLGAWLDGDMTEGALRYVLKNTFTEGLEEAGTSTINLLADIMIAGDKSEWKMAMQAYIDQGKTPEEAFGLVAADQAAQIGLDALGGMLSGFAIGGGTYAGTSVASQFQYGDTGKNKVASQKLVTEGLELNPDSKYIQNAQKKLDKGKNLTGMQVRNILAANQDVITAKDMKKIQQAAEKRLTELGQTDNVAEVAKIATKWATGQEITLAEKKLLTHSQYGSRVANELLPENVLSGKYTSSWAEDIGTESINKAAYNKKAFVRELVERMTNPKAYQSLESRMEGDTPVEVSDTGKAVIRATDEEVDLTKPTFKEITEDGVVLDVNGESVSSNEIDYDSEDQGLAINAIGKIEHITPAAASALYAKLDKTKPVMGQLNGMDEAFTYGYYNYSEADLDAGLFTGNLTKEQLMDAYGLGRYVAEHSTKDGTEAVKKMRTAVDALAEKNAKEGKETPKAKKLTITYNHGGGVVEDIETAKKKLGKLNPEQQAGIEVAKILHQMGIGTDYEFFTSYFSKTLKDENGNPLEVFLNDEGKEEAAYAGIYFAADGKIRINLNAYSGTKGLTLNALSHELTHFIKTWNLDKYTAMAEFLVKSYGEKGVSMHQLVLKEQARLQNIRKAEVSYGEAYDEVVANAFNRMLEDGKVMDRIAEIRQFDKSLGDKIIECIQKFIKRFMNVYQKNPSLFKETEALMEMKDVFEQLQNMFAEALVEASDNFQASLIAKEAGLEVAPVENSTQYSYQSLAEAAGFEAVQNEDGTRSFVRDGQAVSKVTIEDIENSPIGAFINFSLEMGDINDEDAKRQKKMFADICTMACKTNDFAMTMQFVGSAVFTGMKANADKQYGTTYDFPSICTKTQAVIDAMSAKMMSLGRGLNTDEIVQLYNDVFASGNPVPCPECYVFSRWIGIGGLLDNIKKYQDYYGDMAVEDVAAEYRKMKAEVSKFAEEQGISFGKAKGALTSKLTKEFNKLTEKVEKAQNQGEKVKPADLKRLEELEPMMNTVKGMTWLENVYFADSSLKKVNPKFRVPNEVLFDLNNGEAFATQYKDAWVFRTTQGAGYGKAITPYADARLGEGVLVTNNTTNAIKGKAQGSLDNYFLNQKGKLDKQSRDALKRARLKQKIQAFIGGQRFQSTSDARYENASDYLLAALEMQAMRGMVQVYTKVDGAVPAFSAWGFSINQSLMPLNGGLDANGNVKDTSVGGMKPEVAFENRNKHESAGTITIGVNDNHIRAMFKQLVRDFIIPYHASGGKADVVAEFRRIQEGKEAKGKAVRSTDYSRTQSDKILSDEVLRWQGKTEAQIQRIHEIRNARIAILTGGNPNMTVVRSNRFLSALYDKLNGGEWDGVKLAKSKVESQIFPNEFWDQTVTYEESAKITKDYLEYCEDLGFLHRFSGTVPSNGKLVSVNGYNENGEKVQMTDLAYKYDEKGNKTTEVEEFFWKVLTDRRMYDNNGKYLAQKIVTLNDTTTETVTGFAKNNQGREYDKAKAEALAKKIAKGGQYSSQETDLDRITPSMTDAERTEILQKKSVVAEVYDGQAEDAIKRNKTDLESDKIGLVKSALVRIGEEFRIFTDYDIADVDVKIRLSRGNIKESVSKEITPTQIAKLLPVLKTAVENAIGIESHINRYFYDNTTVYFENLLGGYVDGEYFVPVRFGLKHSTTGEVTLYVIVDQQPVESKKIKAEVVKIPDAQGARAAISHSAFKVSVANLAGFVNGKDLLRYLPDDMLSAEQKKTKWEGIAETAKNTAAKNDKKYKQFIADGNLNAVQRMVDQAAKVAGYTIKAWHGSRYIFDKFSKERLGSNTKTKASYGWFFAGDKETANSYYPYGVMKELARESPNIWKETDAENMKHKGKLYSLYLKMENPLIVDVAGYDYAAHAKTADAFMEYVVQAEQNDNDGIILLHVRDNQLHPSKEESTVYMFREPSQAKSADPITYDEQDNVVPISERFNEEKDELRYSTQQTDNITDRDMLANAFETISKNSEEYEMIQEYKSKVNLLNKLEQELNKVNQEIRDIRFGTKEYDAERLNLLEGKAKRLAKDITKHDKRLLNMEASAPLRRVIQEERKKEAQKTKDHVKEIQQNKKLRAEQTELRHKIRKTIRDLNKILNRGNKKQNVKEDMKGFVSKALELADYLFTDHISNDDLIRKGITVRMTPKEAALVKETEDILSQLYDNADSLTDEEFTKLDAKRKANEDKLRDLLTAQRNERLNTPVYNLFNNLVTEYASLKNSQQEAVKGAYDPKVEEFLRSYLGETTDGTDSDRKTHLQNMRVADMTTEELWKLHNAYTMVLHSVRQANSLFVKGKTESIEQMAGRIMSDFSKRKAPEGKVATVIRNLTNKLGWDYEKLYYALDRIGSEAFTELVMNLADAENTVMQDIMEAVAFRDEIVKKYDFNNWAVNKEIDKEFLDNTGKKFKLTLGQLMSLYAYSRREGAWDHIEYGGFVFGEAALTNPKPADSYKLSKTQCEAITNTLTKEQKNYVEDMQKFLSETMGAKGNEVSMLLYGIKMFGEKNYFPIHIAGQFKAQAQESQAKAAAGFGSMTNAGFTHAQNPNAKAPFVLEGFNEVWSDHVNEMSRYHGTVPALEDMRRVMNRSSYSEAESESMAIKQLMENSFGKEAVEYFDNLYREANSGAITDKLQKWPKKLLSLFRKNSVAYSLSVVIQQPSAMARAYAMIDKKYFGFKGVGALTSGIAKAVSSKWNPAYANAYNEMLKYAPGVTMAKELGGFDTHTGSSIREYLLDTGKSFKQSRKTENLLGIGKAVMDLVDDNPIANLPTVADKIAWIEIWNACKRETVSKHKDLATSSDEFLQIVGDRFTEVIRATQVYDSIFAKSPMLKSKNLAVQYLVSFMNEPNTTANMVEKAVRDAIKGDWKGGLRTAGAVTYSIIFNNVLKAIVYAMRDDDEDETYIEKYLAAVAGGMMDDFNPISYIPIARDAWSKARGYDVERPDVAIISDAIEAFQAIGKLKDKDTEGMTDEQIAELDKKMTEASWKLVGSLAAFFGIPVKNIYREIEGVIDHARIASANAGMTTASSIWDKVKDEVIDSIPFMTNDKTKSGKLYDAIISGEPDRIKRQKAQYDDEKAIESAMREEIKDRFKSGDIDNDTAKKYLINYGGLDKDDAESRVRYWSYIKEHPEYKKYELNESNVNKYLDFAKPAGISMDVFVQYRDKTKGIRSVLDEYGDVEVTAKEQVLDVIDSLPITDKQKDALYLAHGYAESEIWDVPW